MSQQTVIHSELAQKTTREPINRFSIPCFRKPITRNCSIKKDFQYLESLFKI